MIDLRWQLPDAPLRTSVITANAIGLVAVIALGSMTRAGLHLGELYPLKAVAVFAVVMLTAIGFVRDHHPFARFGPANGTTTARATLVALVVSLVGEPGVQVVAASAAGFTLLVTALDGVDGWFARRTRMASDFGARFDMETDALLVMALSVLAWQIRKGRSVGAAVWPAALPVRRWRLAVALASPSPSPSIRRQTICVVQVVGLSLTIVPVIPTPLSTVLAAITLSALCYSFLVDVVWLSGR